MRNKRIFIILLAVLAVAGGFLAFAYQSGNVKPVDGYGIKAKFENIGGVSTGSEVRIGGVKVGVVSDVALDAKSVFGDESAVARTSPEHASCDFQQKIAEANQKLREAHTTQS